MPIGPALIGAVSAGSVALAINMLWVDSKTRAATARDGGELVDTRIVAANVKVEGQGPAIVLIHGFGAALDWWDAIVPDLAATHRVIRLDLIGHGGTAAPVAGYSIERQAMLVSDILDRMGVDRFTVIAHSMGGEVATALAEFEPSRIEGMILIDSPATAGGTFTVLTRAYLTPVLGELLSHFNTNRVLRRGLAQGFAPGFAVPDRFVADLRQVTYPAFRGAHGDSIAYRSAKAPYRRLAALQPCPPLFAIFGSRDAIVPLDHLQLFGEVPGARTAVIEGAGHSPLVEAPAQTLELIRSFL